MYSKSGECKRAFAPSVTYDRFGRSWSSVLLLLPLCEIPFSSTSTACDCNKGHFRVKSRREWWTNWGDGGTARLTLCSGDGVWGFVGAFGGGLRNWTLRGWKLGLNIMYFENRKEVPWEGGRYQRHHNQCSSPASLQHWRSLFYLNAGNACDSVAWPKGHHHRRYL